MIHRAIGLGLLAMIVVAAACLDPTQVTVRITTDVDCSLVTKNGATLYSGASAERTVTSTNDCKYRGFSNEVGTLVVVPDGDEEDRVTLTVALGVERESTKCAEENNAGCIVARRRFRFVAHRRLEMPVELSRQCLGVDCRPDQTCFRGACVGWDVPTQDGCVGYECLAGPPAIVDASTNDATLDVAPLDASDVTPSSDVAVDGPPSATAFVADGIAMVPFAPDEAARGLSIYDGTLYWTREGSSPPYRQPLSAGAMSADPSLPAGEYFGITVDTRGYVVAGKQASTPITAFRVRSGVGSYQLEVAGDPVGTADCLATNTVVVLTDAQILSFAEGSSKQGAAHAVTGGAYAECFSGGFYAATASGVLSWDGNSVPPATRWNANGITPRGLAVTQDHFVVTTPTGKIIAVQQASKNQVELAPGAFSKAEDIVFDVPSQTFYLAATRTDGARAIWRFQVPPNKLP